MKPLREINIDDTEFACLKAIVFFDPSKYTIAIMYVNKSRLFLHLLIRLMGLLDAICQMPKDLANLKGSKPSGTKYSSSWKTT